MTSTYVSIRFKNNDGYKESITHYYHFLFAALFPIIHHHLAHPAHKLRILTDVGPMKRFLCELPLGVVELLSERVQSVPSTSTSNSSIATSSSNKNKRSFAGISQSSNDADAAITLPGYDNFGQTLFEANDWVLEQFRRTVLPPVLDFFERSIPPFLHDSPRIRPVLLIERKTEAYFGQAYAEKPPAFWTSGSQRRSIKNHAELRSALQKEFRDDFTSVSLEGTSVAFQHLLFSRAKVVIAQHGGALSNVIFMSSSAQVLEISPPWGRDDNHFKNIAAVKGVGYERVLQEGDHSEVVVGDVLGTARELLRRATTATTATTTATTTTAATAATASTTTGTGVDGASTSISEAAR